MIDMFKWLFESKEERAERKTREMKELFQRVQEQEKLDEQRRQQKAQQKEQRQQERALAREREQQRIYNFEQRHELELDLLRTKYNDFYRRAKRTKLPSVHFTYSCPFNIIPYVVHEWNRNSEVIKQAYSRCGDKASSNMSVINRVLNPKNYSDSNIQIALDLINETEELVSKMEEEHRKYMLEIDIMKKSESIIAYKIH